MPVKLPNTTDPKVLLRVYTQWRDTAILKLNLAVMQWLAVTVIIAMQGKDKPLWLLVAGVAHTTLSGLFMVIFYKEYFEHSEKVEHFTVMAEEEEDLDDCCYPDPL